VAVRQLYESFAGNGGIFGRAPNLLDQLSAEEVATLINTGHLPYEAQAAIAPQRRQQRQPAKRVHESAAHKLAGPQLDINNVAGIARYLRSNERRERRGIVTIGAPMG
jgi:hypothetical protein